MKCSCGADLPLSDDPEAPVLFCPACGAPVDQTPVTNDRTRLAGHASAPQASADEGDRLIGKLLGHGRYRIDSRIGQGGMGTVYLGTQTNLGRRIAIKVLAPELTEDAQFTGRFRREAGTLASLDHPHIVAVHDLGEEDGCNYIVQAYVAGPQGPPLSLRDLMGGRPLDEDMALGLIIQICSALQYAHGRGVVHRDIKPENILIDEKGEARIADFGVARAGLGDATYTLPGTIMGSLRYMSPEQKMATAKVDARSDLYSLGLVIYEMLTGVVPEGRFDLPAAVRPGLDPRLDAIVDRALQSALDRRYQSAADVATDVSRITSTVRPPAVEAKAPPPEAPPRTPPSLPPKRIRIAPKSAPATERVAPRAETAGKAPRAQVAPRAQAPEIPTRTAAKGRAAAILVGLALLAIGVFVAMTRGGGTVAQRPAAQNPEHLAHVLFQALAEDDAAMLASVLPTEADVAWVSAQREGKPRRSAPDFLRELHRFYEELPEQIREVRRDFALRDDWGEARFAGLESAGKEIDNDTWNYARELSFLVETPSARHLFAVKACLRVPRGWICASGVQLMHTIHDDGGKGGKGGKFEK